MQKNVHVNCPTYLELGLKNGQVVAVNGKELDPEGIKNVVNFVCEEVNVKADDVFNKVGDINSPNGAVTLKLSNGVVSAI